MQYNSLKRKRESAFSPNPKKKQIFLPPKQPIRASVSRRSSRKPLPARAVRIPSPPEHWPRNGPHRPNEKNPENWQLVLDKCKTAGIITNVRQANIAGLCNGSTADSDSVCEGSNPSPAAIKRLQKRCSQRKPRFYWGFRHLYGEISANDSVDIKKVFSLCKRF